MKSFIYAVSIIAYLTITGCSQSTEPTQNQSSKKDAKEGSISRLPNNTPTYSVAIFEYIPYKSLYSTKKCNVLK